MTWYAHAKIVSIQPPRLNGENALVVAEVTVDDSYTVGDKEYSALYSNTEGEIRAIQVVFHLKDARGLKLGDIMQINGHFNIAEGLEESEEKLPLEEKLNA